jgi:squalene cyclase
MKRKRPLPYGSSFRRSGINFIALRQRDDGSWYGSWAICFT